MKMKFAILSILAGIILASCSTSNDVVNGNGIQKRKYNNGYYISWGNKFKNTNADVSSDQTMAEIKSEENSGSNKTTLAENVNSESENSLRFIEENTTDNFELSISEPSSEIESNNIANPSEITKHKMHETFKPGRVVSRKATIKNIIENSGSSGDAMLILLVILCLILPPLAVFIFEGASSRFWIDLILFIIGIAIVGWFLLGISGLALLASVIYALLIVLSVI